MNMNEYFQKVGAHTPEALTPVTITGFLGDNVIVERLKEMGFHQGLEVFVAGYAPFGGPLLFRFGSTVLALRREEASCLLV